MAILDKVFQAAIGFKASDLHVTPGEPFIIRRLGRLVKMKTGSLTKDQARQVIFEILSPEQQNQLIKNRQLDFAVDREGIGRFRGSAMLQNNGFGAVFRIIPDTIPALADLGLPPIVEKMLDSQRGLILVTGATGHGKSTTLTAMIDHINTHRPHHILTVESLVEFVHPIKKGMVSQRQVGRDAHSRAHALKSALREDLDVIMISELRDLETLSLAISAAETGHLVLAALPTASASKTIDRIIDTFPAAEQTQVCAMLSESLRAIITQRLIPSADKKKMEMAAEIFINTPPMANLIRDGKTFQIPSMMQTSKNAGMQIMDDAILALLQSERIDVHQAHANADNSKRFQVFMDKPISRIPG